MLSRTAPSYSPTGRGEGRGECLKISPNTQIHASVPCGMDSSYPTTPGEQLLGAKVLLRVVRYFYQVITPAKRPPSQLLVMFHGYSDNSDGEPEFAAQLAIQVSTWTQRPPPSGDPEKPQIAPKLMFR